MAMIDLTKLIDREKEKAEAERAVANAARWQILSLTDLTETLPPIPWLCEGVGMAPGAVSLIAGYGYSRKTMALQSAAVSIAAGRPLWGVYGVRSGSVLHLDYEQGRRVTQERYQRLARGMGFDLAELAHGALRVGSMPRIYLDEQDAPDELLRLCDGVTFVIVDSLRAAFPHADENSSEVRSYLDVLNRVSERTGATIAVIHHARKPNKENADGATFAIRGSSALFDACQSVYVFEGAKDTPTTVHHQKDRIRGVTCEEFGLVSEDVSHGDNHRWGLRVNHLEAQQRFAADRAKAEVARARSVSEVVARIRAVITSDFKGSRADVKALVKGRTEYFDAAWAQLVADSQLERGGTYQKPIWLLRAS